MGRFLTGVSLLLLIIGNAFTVAAAEGESETLPPADLQAIESLVERWDDVLSKRDNAQPQSLYMPQVEWYGQSLSAQQVLANEQAFLAKNTDFCQSIVSTLNIQRSYEDKNIVLVSFVKRAGLTYENEQNYPQEIQVMKSALGWRIVSETDGITLANQSKEKVLMSRGANLTVKIKVMSGCARPILVREEHVYHTVNVIVLCGVAIPGFLQ